MGSLSFVVLERQGLRFYGIYPYQEISSIDPQLFDIATDQSMPEMDGALSGYEASDLMWAKAENISQGNGSVKLRFKHMMSKLVVKLVKGPKFEGEFPEEFIRIFIIPQPQLW